MGSRLQNGGCRVCGFFAATIHRSLHLARGQGSLRHYSYRFVFMVFERIIPQALLSRFQLCVLVPMMFLRVLCAFFCALPTSDVQCTLQNNSSETIITSGYIYLE